MEHFSTGKKRPIFDRYFSFIESKRPSDRFLFLLVAAILISSLLYTAVLFNNSRKETIATSGGTLVEGIIGTPRFANPVLAITRADQDVVTLVYSGLMRLTSEGAIEPDIAENITISEDGLVYNIVLRQNVYFHDGTPLTAADVAYTIGLIQDPTLKSPLRGNWNDVTIEVIDDHEINFVLEEPYTPFIENLTVGILPKHIWGALSIEQLPFSQNNTEPVGSGPYSLETVNYNKAGLIDSYVLSAFDKGDQTANISNIKLNFYQNEDLLIEAFDKNEFYSTAAFSYETLNEVQSNKYNTIEHPLPRVFSVFLNQNKSAALRDEAVRKALSAAIDRDELVRLALAGHGVPTNTPIPPEFLPVESEDASSTRAIETETGIRHAETLLLDAGWKQQEDRSWVKDIDDVETKLAITITTANSEIFEKTAEYIKSAWSELGVDVNIALFEQSDLVQVIIRPRDYQALLFGTDVGRALDMYPFWHSSQKDDPGLNVALYANISTDALLEDARTTQDEAEKIEALYAFEKEVSDEAPAIFLYSPSFTYVVRNDITIPTLRRIVRPSERFSEIQNWHMNENDVWKIFANENEN